ncbi:MAG: SGNH/GDSL hydrolase family protein [Candidatus Aminicenantes bacterium]|nr:SGNH/GDSL hydrolase family protein [Candidatus Aminicenantes bacterium]
MAKKNWRFWLLLIVSAPLFLQAETDFLKRSIKGHSASPIFDRSGEWVLLYNNADEGLSAARQDPASGELRIRNLPTKSALLSPVVKMDRSGRFWVIGEEDRTENSIISLSLMEKNEVVEKHIVSQGKDYRFSPDLAFDLNDNPWVTWVLYTQKTHWILVKDILSGRTWQINSGLLAGSFNPKIVTDSANRIWVVWTGNTDRRDGIYFSFYDGLQWTPARRLDNDTQFPQILPDVGLGPEGLPLATWCAFDGSDYEIYSASWDGRSWSSVERVTDNHAADLQPALSFVSGNIPVYVWSQTEGKTSRICLRYKHSGKWSPVLEIYRTLKTTISHPMISTAADKLGITWQSQDEIQSILLSFPQLLNLEAASQKIDRLTLPKSTSLDENQYIGFGDSITFGYLDYQEAPELGYIPRLEAVLTNAYGPTQIINEGWPGEVTSQGLARLSGVLANYNAQFFLLMEGTNDVVFKRISMDTTAFNLEQMIQICREKYIYPVLTTILPRNDKRWRVDFFRERIFRLNDLIRDLADRIKVSFIDMFEIFYSWPESDGGWTSLLSNDYVHPSIKGYEVMTESWFGEIKQIPFPVINFKAERLIQQYPGSTQEANNITWNHSPKLFDRSNFRAYEIYRTEIDANISTFSLVKTVMLSQAESRIAGSIVFPNHNIFGQGYMDFDIADSQRYKYVIFLVRKDDIIGPNSNIAKDNTQGGTDN